MTIEIGTRRPSFDGATEWLNATGAHAEHETEGHVTLVHFWLISCRACKDNFAQLAQLRDAYAESGLRVVAVHSPVTEEDADTESVRDAALEHGISEPCAIDNEHVLRDRFENIDVELPAYYLFDREGKLVAHSDREVGLEVIMHALETVINGKSGN